ncbi:hypothetical protein [Xanthocytophaga agilis]|uniref:Uncharacterized protein n=1 Tax=Xanthocytophaga agilis TaxID=3048010 RepID=A0AAE3UFV0_9BACT|nr:hypothetical protein [Xanthocytophaga agilis]MDJ1503685.1 hypothetical protein [Xanthocytophaga agilis]
MPLEKYLICIAWLFLQLTNSFAQVPNDNIENRLELTLNQWHSSRTDKCTVQWKCVDEALTGKCIDYHNDQWFYFTTSQVKGPVFVNISKQACEDIRGVQLVVIDGTPCETKTYQILACASMANQDDIYVQLDSLKPNHTYLLNVDGYLHDYCKFDIQVSDHSIGIPMNHKAMGTAKGEVQGKVVNLSWTVDEDIAAQVNEFHILRRRQADVRSQIVQKIPLTKNAAGGFVDHYETQDTLTKAGTYAYKILGLTTEGNTVLIGSSQQQIDQRSVSNAYVSIPLPFKKNSNVTLLIYNAVNHVLLDKTGLTLSENNQTVRYFAGYLTEKGIHKIQVRAVDSKTGQAQDFSFDITSSQ